MPEEVAKRDDEFCYGCADDDTCDHTVAECLRKIEAWKKKCEEAVDKAAVEDSGR